MPANAEPRSPRPSNKIKLRFYCVCSFPPGAVVPTVELVGATCDEEALLVAGTMNRSAERELWDRHRLVAHLPANRGSGARVMEARL